MEADEQSDYGRTWFARNTPLPPSRTPLNYNLDVDVCVIGGGLAGLTAARELARCGWSVAVLEARRIAWNASGRNSGVVLPGFSAPLENVVERIGLQATRALWELSQSGVQYIRDAIAENGAIGASEGNGWVHVSKWPDANRTLARAGLLAEMGINAEVWQTERVRDALRTSHYFEAVYSADGFQIDPLAYALHLADAALQGGARIFEYTRVIAADLAGVRKRIDTPHARVRAGHVVLAGNVDLGSVVRPLADTLIPITAYVGVTKPLGKPLAQAITFHGAVSDQRHGNHPYRIVGGDRLLWTGSAAAGKFWTRTSLERAIRATYPQFGLVRFEYFWPVQAGFAVHRMPQIGEIERGVWLASGFGGQGLNTSAMAGCLIARAIAEGDDAWMRFLPFELVWAGGRAGRTAVCAAAWWQRQSDAALALAARQREEFRRRHEANKKADAGKKGSGKSGPGKAGLGKAGLGIAGLEKGRLGTPGLGKLGLDRLAAGMARTKLPRLNLALPSDRNPMAALKRALKGVIPPDDRPIDAPEALPAVGHGKPAPEGSETWPGKSGE